MSSVKQYKEIASSTPSSPAPLKREEIAVILRRHRGSQQQIADELGIRGPNVNQWLDGRSTSARIAEAAQRKARALLELERQAQAQAQDEDDKGAGSGSSAA